MTRTCARCPATIARYSKSGLCRLCANKIARADPIKEARRVAALRIALGTPEAREQKKIARRRIEAERRDDPKWQAYKRASGQRLRAHYDASPEAQAKNLAKRGMAGRKARATRLAWCPPEYHDDLRRLRRKGLTAAQARALIEDQIVRDRATFLRTGKLQQTARLARDRLNQGGE